MDANRELLHAGFDALHARTKQSRNAVGDQYPYYADPETGAWETTPDGDWCGGHWIGLLWLAAAHADDARERASLLDQGRSLSHQLVEELPQPTMFRGLNCHYAGFRGYDATGDRSLFAIGLTGADDMVELYNERARQIPLGVFRLRGPDNFRGEATAEFPSGHSIGAVDNIYTALPILWRAYRETNTPRFRDVAVSHADRHLDWFVRDDGSTWHHAIFDPGTGDLQRQYNALAYADDTCWARGQGWCIAGLARAYRETGARRYLDALQRTTAYYRRETPSDLVPYWDFARGGDDPRDTSAASLVAYGLTRLPETDAEPIRSLREIGRRILESIVDGYMVLDPDDDRYGMVQQSCYNKPGEYVIDNELICTDYYVAYSLSQLINR